VLTTNIPERAGGFGTPELWYSVTRPCIYCRAEVVKRRETPKGAVIDVKHHPKCDAFKK
jgi:hypothetical protein